ncbi:hypothetical protein NON08_06800 [Cetobacterium somerae]|uniref:hypothetical protein n=1 Tax=Cetobacterium sp. NK01 TaxID=2993530 RepID=UPI0021167C9D|nr:hypothetical protein [Cetobacterium sp. NK01]MCQ8212234.1 hypothetical protein [Cetobacterium sp. NK01]
MRKKLMLIFLILCNYLFSFDMVGQIYNLQKRGSSYKGTLDIKNNSKKKNSRIQLIPSKDIELLGVNGHKNENNIYEINTNSLKIDFIYKDKINSIEEKILVGKLEFLNEIGRVENLYGNIAVEFRKLGSIDMKVKGDIDFGIISSKIPKNGFKSKRDSQVDITLDIDKRDVGNTKMYFQYPKEVSMANGQLIVKIESKEKGDFVLEKVENGKHVKIVGFIPKKENTREKIKLEGRVYSTAPNVSPGKYKESVILKAYYEYLDYSIENKSSDKKVIIRR